MRVDTTSVVAATAAASLLLAVGGSGASAEEVSATADAGASVTVAAGVAMPVSVSGASVTLRPTKVGSHEHPGGTQATPGIAAGTEVAAEVVVQAHAGATVTTSDPGDAVTVDVYEDQHGTSCVGIGIAFVADVAVQAGAAADAALTAGVEVSVGGTPVIAQMTDTVLVHPGGGEESVPIATGADVCLPGAEAGVVAALKAQLQAEVAAAVDAAHP